MANKDRIRSISVARGNALARALMAAGVLLFAAPVFADEAADVTRMMKAGQLPEALARADAFLAQKPKDAQMRFLKGLILTEQNKSTEAIGVFAKLTEDYPDLPEPYNNLAVLYAANGQYDKARAALDMAIRTNPSYATAYENLGDVHAKLASQAYDKALQLDSGNNAAKSKLTLLRSLGGKAPMVAAATAKPPAPSAPAAQAAAAKPAQPTVTPTPTPTPVAKAEPPRQAEKAAAADNDRDDILSTVHGWARAWSSQDVKAYLTFYSSDFQTPNGMSRKAWAEERRSRIDGKGSISVKIESPQVTVNGNTATVKFRQLYVSDRLKADSRKTLTLTRQGSKWLIKQERAGS